MLKARKKSLKAVMVSQAASKSKQEANKKKKGGNAQVAEQNSVKG
jgi:hypothetical protein